METTITPMSPALLAHRLGVDDVDNRLLAHQGGGGEDQTRLEQGGEGFRLAVAVAMLLSAGAAA